MISAIVASTKNGVIGKGSKIPWYLPADLAHFKKITMGHPIIMGRRTHESIGRTLAGRYNLVITHDEGYDVTEGSEKVGSLEEAIKMAKKQSGGDEVMIIGGEQVYKEAMPKLDRIYLTKVDAEIDGDKFFKYSPGDWRQISSEKHSADGKNQYDYEFVVLEH